MTSTCRRTGKGRNEDLDGSREPRRLADGYAAGAVGATADAAHFEQRR